ncbi:MAG TPA: phosphoenolpyruvate carboxykinase (ATP), partial [Xanthobacteraceae bacterium]|nr:phosphoenolpyruvate carboxykinase (ATP) [Xanthobacteraceae bacterium]
MQESGVRNGAHGADKFGLEGLKAVHWNLTEPRLYEFSIAAKEAQITAGGPLCADTGVHTGRSPKDKFVVV